MYAQSSKLYQKPVSMTVTATSHGSSYDPDAFGPAFWYTLHNASTKYPDQPTEAIQMGMQQLIVNLPILIPCTSCKEHFYEIVKKTDLRKATSSRENLFAFFVNVHNNVNMRLNKKPLSLEAAKVLYGFDDKMKGSQIRISYT